MTWRLIETAPKDGTVFLSVWLGKVRMASWNPVGGWQEYPDGDFDIGGELTHWMPLPEFPDSDEIKTVEIDPSQEGWERYPLLPRTWVKPTGEIYRFPPSPAREVLIIPRWPYRP